LIIEIFSCVELKIQRLEFALSVGVRFHSYAPEQLSWGLAFYQQAAEEVGGNLFAGAGKERPEEVLDG
jgi:hypothetical protein